MRVAYRDCPDVSFTVELIRCWVRDEIQEPVMSASSGPKDYTRNHIWAVFSRDPAIARVVMVCGQYRRSVPFLLVADAWGQFFDMAGKEVEVDL